MYAKIIASVMLGAVFMTAQISPALAAAPRQDPTPGPTATPAAAIIGTIQSITLQTDSAGVTTVTVTLLDATGATQTVNLSLATAVSLGLVTTDASGVSTVNDSMIGQSLSIDSSAVLPPAEEEAQNPVGILIAAFFGLDYQTIESYHEEGTGYGVIAQSCWLSFALNGDASQCGAIIEAKKNHDYSAFTLPDGTTASNWGQFKKAILDKHDPLQTLGAIMSGHAHNDQSASDSEASSETDSSNPDHGHGKGNGGGNGHGHGHGKP